MRAQFFNHRHHIFHQIQRLKTLPLQHRELMRVRVHVCMCVRTSGHTCMYVCVCVLCVCSAMGGGHGPTLLFGSCVVGAERQLGQGRQVLFHSQLQLPGRLFRGRQLCLFQGVSSVCSCLFFFLRWTRVKASMFELLTDSWKRVSSDWSAHGLP